MINFYNYINWYWKPSVKFELIRTLRNRELALLNPNWLTAEHPELRKQNVRMLRCHSVQHFDFILKSLNVYVMKKTYNFYYTLAKYINGIPYQTMDLKNRDNEEWKNTKHFEEMIGYDFLIDIDAREENEMNDAYESAGILKKEFDILSVPYELRFSGFGFHFIIPAIYMPKLSFFKNEKNNIYQVCHLIAKRLNKKYSEMIDLKIYDSRRLCKLPYSLALYEDVNYVCTPILTNREFNDFKIYNYTPKTIKYSIENRGTHIFNMVGNINKLLDNLNVKIIGVNKNG